MRLTARRDVTTVLALVMLASLAPASLAQQGQGSPTPEPRPLTPVAQGALERLLEPYVVRLRNQLSLDQDQVTQVRKLLWAHSAKLTDLRNRSQAQPYSAQLAADLDLEQRALREEILTFLTDDQKSKVGQADFRLPIAPPAFILISIPKRATPPDSSRLLAPVEPLLPAVATPAKGRPARLTEDQKLLHLLNRLTFGPRPGDLERLRRIGSEKFIDEQLHPESIDDSDLETRLSVLPTLRMASAELYQFYPPGQVVDQRAKERNPPPVFGTPRQILGEMAQQKLVRAVSSNRQLQEVMTDFWFNHFNVFAQSQWLLTGYERDVIRPRALGRFRDLLAGVAASPAMLVYLDNWLSAAPDSKQPRPPSPRPANLRPNPPQDSAKPAAGANSTSQPGAMGTEEKPAMQGQPAPQPPRPPARKPGINENYARELLELHTMGVDGGYTQKDVQEIARCFTGWTVDRPFQGGGFVFRPWMHDSGGKTVLGVTIPAGGGISDGERVIEILAAHPSTARFVSKKLCRRFVSDEPPAALVERVATVFLKTGGDIRQVLSAIFTSPEFNSASNFRGKVKSPLELVASGVRAVDGDTNGAPALNDWLRRMGQQLYQNQAPTGYSESSTVWMNTGTFLNRLNFVGAFTRNQIAGTGYDVSRLASTEGADFASVTTQLTALILHTDLSAESKPAFRTGIEKMLEGAPVVRPVALSTPAPRPDPVQASYNSNSESEFSRRMARVLELLFGASEFQRR